MKTKDNKTEINVRDGFTLVEVLLYIAGMVVILFLATYLITQIYTTYRTLTITTRVDKTGIALVDQIGKEIRTGNTINFSESIFDVPNGVLSFSSPSTDMEDTVSKVFSLADEQVTYQVDSDATRDISPSDLRVTSLVFSHLTTPVSEAVRYTIDITYTVKDRERNRSYSGLSILRHSYD